MADFSYQSEQQQVFPLLTDALEGLNFTSVHAKSVENVGLGN